MISIGLAAAFARRGQSVASFKKGPDYIDPIWLQAATGRPCWNLDFFTMSREEISDCFQRQALGASIVLIEGNKGLHDGLDVEGSDSSAALAKLLDCPVVLVLDATGITRGIVPLIEGYQAFDPQVNLAGVILNRVGEARHEEKLRAAIGHYSDLPILGSIGRSDVLHIKERHLGLVPGNEREDTGTRVQQLADQIERDIDLDRLLELTERPELEEIKLKPVAVMPAPDLRIGIARDAAFGFYYPDDLAAFRHAGAELVTIDTLRDAVLPPVDGLFLGGGFPECFIEPLSRNETLRNDIREFILDGGPTYAECGGLMYLCRSIRWQGMQGKMVGVISADATMEPKPVGRGYVKFRPTTSHPWPGIATANPQQCCAHEFHYSRLEHLDPDLERVLQVTRGFGIDGRTDGIVCHNLLATYAHQRNVGANPWVRHFVDFVRSCRSS